MAVQKDDVTHDAGDFVRPFADWLREQSGGTTHEELSEKLAELAAAVKEVGKKGTLTFTITIAPFDKVDPSVVTVADEVKVNLPQHDRRKAVFYADDFGNLTRDNPMQPTFEGLREVGTPSIIDIKEKKA